MQPWQQTTLNIGLLILLGSGIGVWLGYGLVGFATGALLAHIWLIVQLWQFERWLERKDKTPPRNIGPWGILYQHFAELYKRSRKRKRKLHSVRSQFRQALSALPDAVVIINESDQTEWFNRAAIQLLGLEPNHDFGLPVTQLVRHPRFIEFCEHFADTVIFPSPVRSNTLLQARSVPYGKNQRLLIIADISETQRLDQIRRDFVANASHELRTPLTVMVGYLESLLDDDLPQWASALTAMQQQSDRMMHIIQDLLLLSQLENNSDMPPVKPVNIKALLDNIINEANELGASKHQCIEHRISTEQNLTGVETELRSAFSNLIFNAVHHTRENTLIEVEWYEDETGLHLRVADNGEGIAAQHIPRLTERFYRVDRSRKRCSNTSHGTGLGLAIVKHVLQRHHAVLRINSEVGVGSEFYCDFPKPAPKSITPNPV